MSLNIITVTLNMGKYFSVAVFLSLPLFCCLYFLITCNKALHSPPDHSFFFIVSLSLPPSVEKYNFLGISIVGQSNERGDGGIYIGSIMKGGAVAADGRIEPGDMLLQVRARMF